jgi:hypothetical protein
VNECHQPLEAIACAEEGFERAIALDPNNVVGMRAVFCAYVNGFDDLNEAKALYQEGTSNEDVVCMFNLGRFIWEHSDDFKNQEERKQALSLIKDAAAAGSTYLGVFSTKMKPRASAPASMANSASATLVIPQIFTLVTSDP